MLVAIGIEANDSDLTAHKDDTDIHVSTTEKDNWNGKANASDLTAHTDDTDIHVTAENKTLWNTVSNKVNKEDGKALLADTDKTNYDDAVTKAHTHENKEVLDGITSDKVTAWDNKSEFSGSYNDLNDKPTIDAELSNTSENAIQNKVVTKEINKLYSDISFNDHDTATSGTSFTDAEDGNMIVTDWTKNLVNPTLKTTTQNGVTCTNNGDGTYTLNGTATKEAIFGLAGDASALYKRIVGKNVLFLDGGHKYNSKYRILFTVTNSDYTKWGSPKYDGDSFVVPSGYDLVLVDIHVNSGTTVNNLVVKPMITFNLDATNNDFVPYGGYEIKSCGKNLFNPTLEAHEKFGVTCTKNVDTNGKPDGTYTINGTSTKDRWISFGTITLKPGKYKFIATENNVEVSNLCVSLNQTMIAIPGNIFIIQSKCVCNIGLSTMDKTFNNVLIKPMITTDLSATYDDFEPYTDETITVTNDTESPAFGLKSHKGITNIISPGNVKCVYPTNESGKGVLDSLYNKDKMLTEQKNDLGGLTFSASGTTLSITDGTNTWTLEANS